MWCCQLIIHLLPYVQSSVNPFIYSFMSHNFRCTVRSLWRRLRERCRRGPPGGANGRRSTDWNFIEMAVDGRSVRNTSLMNTRMARTASMLVWTVMPGPGAVGRPGGMTSKKSFTAYSVWQTETETGADQTLRTSFETVYCMNPDVGVKIVNTCRFFLLTNCCTILL